MEQQTPIIRFEIGRVDVRLEIESKATYAGLWTTIKRGRRHWYLWPLPMLQVHVIMPKRTGARFVSNDVGAPLTQAELQPREGPAAAALLTDLRDDQPELQAQRPHSLDDPEVHTNGHGGGSS